MHRIDHFSNAIPFTIRESVKGIKPDKSLKEVKKLKIIWQKEKVKKHTSFLAHWASFQLSHMFHASEIKRLQKWATCNPITWLCVVIPYLRCHLIILYKDPLRALLLISLSPTIFLFLSHSHYMLLQIYSSHICSMWVSVSQHVFVHQVSTTTHEIKRRNFWMRESNKKCGSQAAVASGEMKSEKKWVMRERGSQWPREMASTNTLAQH